MIATGYGRSERSRPSREPWHAPRQRWPRCCCWPKPNDKVVLKDTFSKANLPAEIEVYEGAAHGWCPPDSGVYNEPQAEKAWSRLLALYGKALA